MIWEVRCGAEAGRESVGKAVEWMVVVGNSEQMRPKSPRERTCRQYPDLQTFRTPDHHRPSPSQALVLNSLVSGFYCSACAGSDSTALRILNAFTPRRPGPFNQFITSISQPAGEPTSIDLIAMFLLFHSEALPPRGSGHCSHSEMVTTSDCQRNFNPTEDTPSILSLSSP